MQIGTPEKTKLEIISHGFLQNVFDYWVCAPRLTPFLACLADCLPDGVSRLEVASNQEYLQACLEKTFYFYLVVLLFFAATFATLFFPASFSRLQLSLLFRPVVFHLVRPCRSH